MKRLIILSAFALLFGGCTIGYSVSQDSYDAGASGRRVESSSKGFALFSLVMPISDNELLGNNEFGNYGLAAGNGIWLTKPESAFSQLERLAQDRNCSDLKTITVEYNQEINLWLIAFPTIRVSAKCIRE